jgi:hypothetical protein
LHKKTEEKPITIKEGSIGLLGFALLIFPFIPIFIMNLLKKVHLLLNLSMAIGLIYTLTTPVLAAEEISDGKTTIKVSDIEQFAQTGKISTSLPSILQDFDPGLLAPMRDELNQPITLEDLQKYSLTLKGFLKIPDDRADSILSLLAQKANGMTIVQLLKALPAKTITPENLMSVLANFNPQPADVVTNIPTNVVANILYLNSTRGIGTGDVGNYRKPIANTLENYQNGTIFDVDFVQTQTTGNLAYWLNSKPTGYYNQIWFDTTIYATSLLNIADLAALNSWASNKQPEFILDSSFFARNYYSNTLSASAAAVTISEALALKNKGGGIFIGTDHNDFAYTANQILTNFGFDGLFTGVNYITANGSFVGDLLLGAGSVGPDFFTNNLQGLSTSAVPIGKHTLNENGGNRNIEIFESLFSYSPGKIAHVGASFQTGTNTTDITNPKEVPEPVSITGMTLGILGIIYTRRRRYSNRQGG